MDKQNALHTRIATALALCSHNAETGRNQDKKTPRRAAVATSHSFTVIVLHRSVEVYLSASPSLPYNNSSTPAHKLAQR